MGLFSKSKVKMTDDELKVYRKHMAKKRLELIEDIAIEQAEKDMRQPTERFGPAMIKDAVGALGKGLNWLGTPPPKSDKERK